MSERKIFKAPAFHPDKRMRDERETAFVPETKLM